MKFNNNCETLKPYLLSNRFKEDNDKILLDWNESTKIFSNKLVDDIEKSSIFSLLNFYGDNNCKLLNQKLSNYLSVPKSSISVFNGSDSALNISFECILEFGDIVMKIEPEYSQIDTFITMKGAKIHRSRFGDIFSNNIELINHDLKKQNIKVFYLSNPNNPTGRILSKAEIAGLLEINNEIWFFIDEAYVEFSGNSIVSLTNKYKNLIVFRTFSKAFSLAGIRIGYIISNKKNIEMINKVKNGKDVGSFNQKVATLALEHTDDLKNYIKEMKIIKNKTIEALRFIKGLETIDTDVNYFLIRTKHNSSLVNYLKEKNILIRDRSMMHGMANCSRITVGNMNEMSQLIQNIKYFFKKNS